MIGVHRRIRRQGGVKGWQGSVIWGREVWGDRNSRRHIIQDFQRGRKVARVQMRGHLSDGRGAAATDQAGAQFGEQRPGRSRAIKGHGLARGGELGRVQRRDGGVGPRMLESTKTLSLMDYVP